MRVINLILFPAFLPSLFIVEFLGFEHCFDLWFSNLCAHNGFMKLFNLLVKRPEITSCAVIVKISVQTHKLCSCGPRFVYSTCGWFPRSVVHVFWFLRSYASKPDHYNCFKKQKWSTESYGNTKTTGLIKPHNHELQREEKSQGKNLINAIQRFAVLEQFWPKIII